MAVAGPTRTLLHILNTVLVVLALAIAATSLWFFVQVYEMTSLRNANHYLLDYQLYWPQVIPWLFFFVSVLVLCVSGCGFAGAGKGSRSMMIVYVACSAIAIVALVAVAIIALVFADSKTTDDFIKDTMWDAFTQSKQDRQIESSFGLIERKLQCCGADSPRDYKTSRDTFPVSCCDTYYHAWGQENYFINCEFTNKLANERHGCSTVATQYTRIVIKVLSGALIILAFLKIFALVIATSIAKSLNTKTRVLSAQHESDSKKGLL